MLRMTVIEVAEFLQRETAWVYASLKALGYESVNSLLGIDPIYDLVIHNFSVKSFDEFDYNKIAQKQYIDMLRSVDAVADLKDTLKVTKNIFFELAIAFKAIKPDVEMWNVSNYLSDKLEVDKEYKKELKKYITDRFVALAQEDESVIDYFMEKKKLNEIEEEARMEIKNQILSVGKI